MNDREALELARQKLIEQDEFIQQMMSQPQSFALVVHVDKEKGKAVVSRNGDAQLVVLPKEHKNLKPGNAVWVLAETSQIFGPSEFVLAGEICYVADVQGQFLLIESDGFQRRVRHGLTEVKKGDRVVVDSNRLIATENLGPEKQRYAFETSINVTWDMIAGYDDTKRAMREAIELPLKHPQLWKRYGKRPTKGVLLFGPPGCGKTMMAKAAATSVGARSKGGFIYIKGPEVLDKYVGESERRIREAFGAARRFKEETGTQAVMFIDEADAILGSRGTRQSYMEKTIVPSFLAELDGLDDAGAMVILATNRQDTLDSAVVRDGRVDKKIFVRRPSRQESLSIAELYLKNKPTHKSEPDELAELLIEHLFSADQGLYRIKRKSGEKDKVFGLRDLASGSLVEGIVESATQLAIRRDLDTGKALGIHRDDVIHAVANCRAENSMLNHAVELEDFCSSFTADVASVQRV